MKHVFYLIAVIFIIRELMDILSPKLNAEQSKKFAEQVKLNKGKLYNEMTEEYKGFVLLRFIPSLFILFWMICGLLTFNWFAFLSVLVFNFVIIAPISNLSKYSTFHTVLHWFNSLIGFTFGVFVIINSYHLKIDTYELFIQWVNSL